MDKYLKVSPRGFANEVIYYVVPADKVDEANREYAYFEDTADGGYACWTDDKIARRPWVAVKWADRN